MHKIEIDAKAEPYGKQVLISGVITIIILKYQF